MATDLAPLPFDQSHARPEYEHASGWAPYDTEWASKISLEDFRKRFPQHECEYLKFGQLCHVWRFQHNQTTFQVEIPGKGSIAGSAILIDVPEEEEKTSVVRQNISEFVALLQADLAKNSPASIP
jgi:hypothetical protein